MKRTLHVIIEAGEHTCRADDEAPWCPFVRWAPFGRSRCDLFDKALPEVNQDGTPASGLAWLGRLAECKAAEGGGR